MATPLPGHLFILPCEEGLKGLDEEEVPGTQALLLPHQATEMNCPSQATMEEREDTGKIVSSPSPLNQSFHTFKGVWVLRVTPSGHLTPIELTRMSAYQPLSW